MWPMCAATAGSAPTAAATLPTILPPRMLTRRTRLDRPGRFETGATAKAVARAGTGRYPLPTQPTNPPVVRLRLAERNCRFRP